MTLLLALRIHGPIEIPTLAEKLNLCDCCLREEAERLQDRGLAQPNLRDVWSCTEDGRRVVDGHGTAQVRECVGVSPL